MAGSLTNYGAKYMLDYFFGATANTTPGTWYFGLMTAAAAPEAGTVTEVSTATWTNYDRVDVTNNTTNFPNVSAADPYAKVTGAAINFGTVTASGSVVVTHMGIWDSGTPGAGNLVAWSDLTTSKTISNGDTASFATGAFTISLD